MNRENNYFKFIADTFILTSNIGTGFLELTINQLAMNGFVAQWLELTTDLPAMNGFISLWLEHLPRHRKSPLRPEFFFQAAFVAA